MLERGKWGAFSGPAIALAALLVACGSPAPEATPEPTRRPNIVFIFADDLGYGDVGAYGGTVIQTPHIDALAGSGVRVTQGYVSHPVCSPSRAGLLTGRYQQRHGWEFNPALRDRTTGMSTEERTFADQLKAAGYATGMVGKWHLGHEGPHHPLRRGFDEYFGVLDGGTSFIDSRREGVESPTLRGGPPPTERGNPVFRGFDEVEVEEYLTDVFTDEAVRFIERHRDEPFLLYLSHTTPHTPLQATAQYLDPYRHIEDPFTRVYAAMVASLDTSVRRVVETLEREGLREDTLIVFASDNGCAGYIRGACSNAPFAGYKRYHHEGGIRVPFILSWPKRLPAGATYDHPVISLDLFATFAAASGSPAATEDSVDLLPFLDGTRTDPPHEHLFWRSGPSRAVRDARYKLIELPRTNLRPGDLRADGRLAPPEGGWPVAAPHGHLTLLYDLQSDPGETTNLAAARPDDVERLRSAWEAWNGTLQSSALLPPIRSTLAEIDGTWVQLLF